MATKAQEKIAQYEDSKQTRSGFEPTWQELGTFVQPKRSDILFKRSPGQSQTERLFDATAVLANDILAASMQGSLTSNAVRFFGLGVRNLELDKKHQLRLDLDACASEMYSAIQQSNFASESHEMYQDLGSFGTGGVFVEELPPRPGVPFGGINHVALHPGEYCIDENAEGYVDKVFRSFRLSARAAIQKWGTRISERVRKLEDKAPSTMVEFLHVVEPNDYGGRVKRFPYSSCYIELEAASIVNESGFDEFPFMVPRWSKTSGELYGRGPGHIALADIKTLNKTVELKLRALALIVNPPIMVRDEGVIGVPKLNPFGITHVRDMEAIKPMWELGRIDVANMEEDKYRQQIRRAFYSDQLQLQDGPQMTAMEAQIRYELMQRVLGPTLGRLEVEWLGPYIERVFFMMLRRSKPESPFRRVAKTLKAMGRALDIEYESPLARAQKLQESVAVQRFFQIAIPLAQVNPEVLDKVNFDEVIDVHAFGTGVPTRILNDAETVKQMREGRKQAQDEMNERAKTQEQAQNLGAIAPAAKALLDAGNSQVIPSAAGGPVPTGAMPGGS